MVMMTFFISLILIILIIYTIAIFNGMIRLKNNIKKSWSNIDVLLKQRYDELPKLIDTVKGYMKYERNLFLELTEARTGFLHANTMSEKAVADNELSDVLMNLFAVAENYPKLKANKTFLYLQKRITMLENEIADRREFYNDSVNIYNIRIQSFPDLFLAKLFKFKEKERFMAKKFEAKSLKVTI
jgi:LemA protein